MINNNVNVILVFSIELGTFYFNNDLSIILKLYPTAKLLEYQLYSTFNLFLRLKWFFRIQTERNRKQLQIMHSFKIFFTCAL